MRAPVSAIVPTTPSGLPRYSECSSCSTEAKKELRSIWRKPKRSGWGWRDIGGCAHYIRLIFASSEVMCGDGTDKHRDCGALCVGRSMRWLAPGADAAAKRNRRADAAGGVGATASA